MANGNAKTFGISLCFLLIFILMIPQNTLYAHTPVKQSESSLRSITINPSQSNKTWTLFPSVHMYPTYYASPHRPKFQFGRLSFDDAQIPQSGNDRFRISAGARFPIFRYNRWQLDINGGLFGEFDNDNSQDNIGWDGIFGGLVSYRLSPSTVLKGEFKHQSGHRGDEFIQRTGLQRIDYTREEFIFGVSHSPFRFLRIYSEGGLSIRQSNPDLQESGRIEWGAEYRRPYPIFNQRTGFFGAVDLEAFEERDWTVDSTFQVGFFLRRPVVTWRVGLEYRDGRPPMGEFFNRDERYLGFSLWMDLFDGH